MAYSFNTIETVEAFKNIKSIWDQLLMDKTSYRPYLEHDWFQLWLNHFKDKHKLLIMVITQKNITKAICPLLIKKNNFRGIPVRKIELIGNIYSPIRNFIFPRMSDNEKGNIFPAILKTLLHSVNWDIIDLQSLPEEDFDFRILKLTLKEIRFKWKEYFCFGNWYLDNIDFTGDQYIESRTSNIRNNIKRYSRKLHKMGKFEFVMVTNENDKNIDHFMDSYYHVYHNSWKAREMDPTFHRDLAKLARDRGWLRLGFLFLDKTPIASQLWLVCDGVAYIVKLAYDENYRKYIPGVILSSEMMKYVIDIDRVKEVDYLIGDEPYKKDWTPKRRERKGLLIFNNNLKGRYLAFLTHKIQPAFKKYKFLYRFKNIVRNLF